MIVDADTVTISRRLPNWKRNVTSGPSIFCYCNIKNRKIQINEWVKFSKIWIKIRKPQQLKLQSNYLFATEHFIYEYNVPMKWQISHDIWNLDFFEYNKFRRTILLSQHLKIDEDSIWILLAHTTKRPTKVKVNKFPHQDHYIQLYIIIEKWISKLNESFEATNHIDTQTQIHKLLFGSMQQHQQQEVSNL